MKKRIAFILLAFTITSALFVPQSKASPRLTFTKFANSGAFVEKVNQTNLPTLPNIATTTTVPTVKNSPIVSPLEGADFTPTNQSNVVSTTAEYVAWLRANGHPNAEVCSDDQAGVCYITR